MKTAAARWKRVPGGKTHLSGPGLQNTLLILLVFWMILPTVYLVIDLVILHQTNKTSGYTWFSEAEIMCAGYAKYFYILGVATICAVVYGLPRILPVRTELRSAARQRPWCACLAFMLLWSILSTLFSDSPFNCFWGLRYHNDGLGSYFIYAAVYTGALLLSRSRSRMALLRIFPFMGVFCSLMMFLQFHEVASNIALQASAPTAVFFNTNHCAYYLTMSILCTAGLLLYDPAVGWRIWYPLAFAVQSYALILNNTIGCYLAVLLALPLVCVFWFRSGRREILPPLLLVAIFLLMSAASIFGILPSIKGGLLSSFSQIQSDVTNLAEDPTSSAALRGGSGRIVLWVGALKQIARHPLFGLGPDSPVLPTEKSRIIRAHNEYLQHAMLLGLPALAAYLGAIFSLLACQWKRLREAEPSTLIAGGAVAGYLISSFFGITIFYTTPFFFFLLGLASRVDSPPLRGAPDSAPVRGSIREAMARTAILLVCFLYSILTAVLYRESRRERVDLNNCHAAVIVGETVYETGVGLNERFWFDPLNKKMISTDSAPPAPYGQGTSLNGKLCMTSTASAAGYSLENDYQRRVILVSAKPIGNRAGNGTDAGGSSEPESAEAAEVKAGVDFEVSIEWVYIPD